MTIYALIAVTVGLLIWGFTNHFRSFSGRASSPAGFRPPPETSVRRADGSTMPISVNYHFTRRCNMSCGFCFHTATTSHVVQIEDAIRGITLLKEAGMRKINFAGGEPFLYPRFLGRLLRHCKEVGVESVSIVSNGSKVTESFLERHGSNIDILAISCDSFDEQTNWEIGRGTGSNVRQLHRVKQWCEKFGIRFKLNTVVCRLNWMEDMNENISALSPYRWKCFQVLIVEGENDSAERLRDATNFCVTSDEFEQFIEKHHGQKSLVPEPNRLMAKSYLILDEYMRFLDRTGRQPSRSILEVGVKDALESVFWDVDGFYERGGVYDWRAHLESGNCADAGQAEILQW